MSGLDSDLARGVLAMLRADGGVRALLGEPARLFDDETEGAAYPFAVLERHERVDASASLVAGAEHRLSFATLSRHGGRAEAKAILSALRVAVETTIPDLAHQRVVIAHATYSDVMRRADRRAFRGVLRVRIVTEEI